MLALDASIATLQKIEYPRNFRLGGNHINQ
jgi:hypothetical protein